MRKDWLRAAWQCAIVIGNGGHGPCEVGPGGIVGIAPYQALGVVAFSARSCAVAANGMVFVALYATLATGQASRLCALAGFAGICEVGVVGG